MRSWVQTLLMCFSLWAGEGFAVIETYEFSSPDLAARYHRLSQELRCPKCQNQNIADSNAPIARDLRVVLHDQLEQGASDEEILAFMVARYGEFVRYRPSVDRHTIWLWVAPLGLMCMGVMALAWHFRNRQTASPAPLTAAEQAQLEKLLKEPRA